MKKLVRNTSTEDSRAFWEKSPEAQQIHTWPEWKRAGIKSYDGMPCEPRSRKSSKTDKK